MEQNENSFRNIIYNILIPVFILNKGHKWGLDPKLAVVIALSFPLFFSIHTWFKTRKLNFISLLGLVNVLVSGTLTILALGGMWFAVKEAAFPLLIGGFVFGSAFSKNPFFKSLFMNPNTFDIEKINQKLDSDDKRFHFSELMKKSTLFLSVSFIMSAILNFILALRIFTPLPESMLDLEKQKILNEQLSQMTLYSLGVILLPSMIFLGSILYYTFKKINTLTGLKTEELLIQSKT